MFENLRIRNLRIGRFRLFRGKIEDNGGKVVTPGIVLMSAPKFKNEELTRFYDSIKSVVRNSELHYRKLFWEIVVKELKELDKLDSIIEQKYSIYPAEVDFSEGVCFEFYYTEPPSEEMPQESKVINKISLTFLIDIHCQLNYIKEFSTFRDGLPFCKNERALDNGELAFKVSVNKITYSANGLELWGHSYDDSTIFPYLEQEYDAYFSLNRGKEHDEVYYYNHPFKSRKKFLSQFDYENPEMFNNKCNFILGTYIPIYHSNPTITLFKKHETNPNIRYVRTCKLEETGWREMNEIYEGENKIAYFDGKKWVPCDAENIINLDEIVKVCKQYIRGIPTSVSVKM